MILRHARRWLVTISVTANPTAQWIAEQVTDAFPWGEAPSHLIRDPRPSLRLILHSSHSGNVDPRSSDLWLLKTPNARKVWSFWIHRRNIAGMLKFGRSIVSRLVCRFRSRAALELENLALRHQLHVLRRQRPGRSRLFAIDRLLWVWLDRLWPRCLEAIVLVKPTTVFQWHRQDFRLFWRWRSKSGRSSVDREISSSLGCRTPASEDLCIGGFSISISGQPLVVRIAAGII